MDYRKAKVGTKVRFLYNTDMAAKGTEGEIIYLRSYNRELGHKIRARFVQVWVKLDLPAHGRAPARHTEHSVMTSTRALEIIKGD